MKIKKPTIILSLLLSSVIIGLMTFNSNSPKNQITGSGAALFISPESGSFLVNNNFPIRIQLNTDEEINAIQATILFPPDKLDVIGLSKEKSILSFWIIEPSYSNVDGIIQFIGGIPNPGFKGEGEIFTIVFKPKKEGKAHIKFKEGLVLANDGKGTNVLKEERDALYSFINQSPSDLNDDGFVNMVDLSILFSSLGVPENSKADINKDGRVDIGDVSMLIFNFGEWSRSE